MDNAALAYLTPGRRLDDTVCRIRGGAMNAYCFGNFTRAEDPRNRSLGDMAEFVYDADERSTPPC